MLHVEKRRWGAKEKHDEATADSSKEPNEKLIRCVTRMSKKRGWYIPGQDKRYN